MKTANNLDFGTLHVISRPHVGAKLAHIRGHGSSEGFKR